MECRNQLFSVNRLKQDFGLQPSLQAIPVEWWTHYQSGRQYPVYRLADCVKIEECDLSARQTSLSKVSRSISDLFEQGFVVLDTETTGLGDHDQLIELAIIDDKGNTLHDARYRPTVDISTGAANVHGITAEALKDKPTFEQDAKLVNDLLQDKTVVIFNAEYDIKILRSTYRTFGLAVSFLDQLKTHCAMRSAASAYGATNRYGTISLINAFIAAGGDTHGMKAHTALGDCLATLYVMKSIAQINDKHEG
jgi:DNA polymerase-3 subunit epsilon